jgi:hypothetical protein
MFLRKAQFLVKSLGFFLPSSIALITSVKPNLAPRVIDWRREEGEAVRVVVRGKCGRTGSGSFTVSRW